MRQKHILILIGERNWLSQSMADTKLVDVCPVYRKVHGISKAIYKLQQHINKEKRCCWYNPEWTEHVADYDTIILFDAFEDSGVVEYINDKAPKTRLIIYYYNLIKRIELLHQIQQLNCEIWSFDKNDACKYGLKYNPQFYFKQLNFGNDTLRDFDYESDVFFVGKDKGRLQSLMDIDKKLRQESIETKFIVVGDRKQRYTKTQKAYLRKHISYAECIEYVKHTKCIFDMVQTGQKGMTWRIVEAMFFNKKLITNNDEILSMDFYDPSNIYLIGKDYRSMSQFILEGQSLWQERFVREYSFENWLDNFMSERNN
jgi:hypothetical protein